MKWCRCVWTHKSGVLLRRLLGRARSNKASSQSLRQLQFSYDLSLEINNENNRTPNNKQLILLIENCRKNKPCFIAAINRTLNKINFCLFALFKINLCKRIEKRKKSSKHKRQGYKLKSSSLQHICICKITHMTLTSSIRLQL